MENINSQAFQDNSGTWHRHCPVCKCVINYSTKGAAGTAGKNNSKCMKCCVNSRIGAERHHYNTGMGTETVIDISNTPEYSEYAIQTINNKTPITIYFRQNILSCSCGAKRLQSTPILMGDFKWFCHGCGKRNQTFFDAVTNTH